MAGLEGLFNVDGLVAVISGGGTGLPPLELYSTETYLTNYRHWIDDGEGSRSAWRP
jgi:hypothetical protein